VRVCIVYDCLYPYTIGGAERWSRNLARRLADAGHEVDYLTLRQWPRGERPELSGVRVVPVGPRMQLYADGRRRIAPPLVFGAGVLAHLLRNRRRYDVVHTASFPYFSVLAAAAVRRSGGFRLIVDWHEVWTRGYWREYLGVAGRLGWLVQKRCARVPQTAFCFSRLHAQRLRELGLRSEPRLLEGEFEGPIEPQPPVSPEPVAVFAGRHIPEKRVPAVVRAVAEARGRIPGLRGEIYGDGPERDEVLALIEELGLDGVVDAPGFVAEEVLDERLRRALCLVLPSQREGYGLVVVEASARGVPSVVAAGPDNAATELVEEGVNGFVAPTAEPGDLADALVRVHEAGEGLRQSTADWYRQNAERLSLASSLEAVLATYDSGP
jgi:glycosyltransferase involved in cell wall biosynthesis